MIPGAFQIDPQELAAVLPDCYAEFRPVVADGLTFFLRHLSPSRLAEIFQAQADLPADADLPRRLVLFLYACPALHKIGQVVGATATSTRSCAATFRSWKAWSRTRRPSSGGRSSGANWPPRRRSIASGWASGPWPRRALRSWCRSPGPTLPTGPTRPAGKGWPSCSSPASRGGLTRTLTSWDGWPPTWRNGGPRMACRRWTTARFSTMWPNCSRAKCRCDRNRRTCAAPEGNSPDSRMCKSPAYCRFAPMR